MRNAIRWMLRIAAMISALAWLALGTAWARSHFAGDMFHWQEHREIDGRWLGKEWVIYSGGGALMVERSVSIKKGVFAEMMKVAEHAPFRRTKSGSRPPGMGDIDAWRIPPLGIAWGSRQSVTRAPESEDFSEVHRTRGIGAYAPVWVVSMVLPMWCAVRGRRQKEETSEAPAPPHGE